MVNHRQALSVSYFSDCFMEEAYKGGLDVNLNYGSSRRPQGLSWGTLICISENILEPHLSPYMPLYLVVSLVVQNLNGILCSQEPPLLNQWGFFFFLIIFIFRTFSSSSTGFFFFFSWPILGYVTAEVWLLCCKRLLCNCECLLA